MSSTIAKIITRDKSVVDFYPDKITTAIRKAFIEVRKTVDENILVALTAAVVKELEQRFPEATPSVEHLQDLVEKHLMQSGYFDVAKAYILYRYEHAKERAAKKQENIEKIEHNALTVTKRSGKKELFSMDKLRASLMHAARGFEKEVNVEAILNQCRSELYEGIKTKDIGKALIMTVRAMIEQDPAYSKVASRLLLSINYKETIGVDTIDYAKLDAQYREAFVKNIKRGVELERLDPKLLTFDLEALSKALVIERDDEFVYLGLQTLYDRYFVTDFPDKRVLETPQMFWMRIAMGTAILEGEKKHDWTIRFYDIMSKLLYTPSTPTLFHAGTHKPQLSSCYLNTVGDSLESIFKTYADNSQLSKWSGGTELHRLCGKSREKGTG